MTFHLHHPHWKPLAPIGLMLSLLLGATFVVVWVVETLSEPRDGAPHVSERVPDAEFYDLFMAPNTEAHTVPTRTGARLPA
jgi:hypothetical protein